MTYLSQLSCPPFLKETWSKETFYLPCELRFYTIHSLRDSPFPHAVPKLNLHLFGPLFYSQLSSPQLMLGSPPPKHHGHKLNQNSLLFLSVLVERANAESTSASAYNAQV